jgi:3-oxoacyl-[acyl-carrier protein] reductase
MKSNLTFMFLSSYVVTVYAWKEDVRERRMKTKTVMITGASKGIGASLALGCARRGYNLALTYCEGKKRAEGVVKECQELGSPTVNMYWMDAKLSTTLPSILDEVVAEMGLLDVLVNNAGIIVKKKIEDHSAKEILDLHLINSVAPQVLMSHAIATHAVRDLIINIGSDVGSLDMARDDMPVYCSAKASVIHVTFAVSRGVDTPRIVCISPDKTGTDMNDGQGRPIEQTAEVILEAIEGRILISPGQNLATTEVLNVK